MNSGLIDPNSIPIPIFAKKTGVNKILENVSALVSIYPLSMFVDNNNPARKAPVISATPNTNSAHQA